MQPYFTLILKPYQNKTNNKIRANKKVQNNINIRKDIKNYYEETEIHNKKLSKDKTYINIAEITEIVSSSITTTATTTSVEKL